MTNFQLQAQAEETIEERLEKALLDFKNPNNDWEKRMVSLEVAVFESLKIDFEQAKQLANTASSMADTTSISFIKLVSTYVNGLILKNENEFEEAIQHFEKVALLAKKVEGGTTYHQISQLEIGQCNRIMGNYTKALEYFDYYLEYYQKELESGDDSNNPLDRISTAHNLKGICYDMMGKFDTAMEQYEKAIEIALETKDPELRTYYGNLGVSHYFKGELRRATDLFLLSVEGAEKAGDKINMVTNYINIQAILAELQDFEAVIEYGQKAEKIAIEIANDHKLSSIYTNLGDANVKLKRNDEGFEYYNKAYELSKKIKNPEFQATNLTGMGNALMGKKEFKKAEDFYKKAIELNEGKEELFSERPKRSLGILYAETGRYSEAIPLLEEAVKLNKNKGEELTLTFELGFLATAYAEVGQYSKAFALQKEYSTLRDSIVSDDKIREITRLESEYEYKNEKALLVAEQEKQKVLLEAKAERNLFAAFGIGALALLSLGFLFSVRRKNKIIASANTQLEQLNYTKDRIFSIIGHDLRKPAIAFRGIAKKVNYLLKKGDYKTLEQLGAGIERDAVSINRLTDNLLSWALTQKKVMPYNPTVINLSEKVNDIFSFFSGVFSDKDIELENRVPEEISVYADSNTLDTILRNLIDNAIKFTPQGGNVSITAISEKEGVKLEVIDTGIGIPQEKVKDIFLLKKGKSAQGTMGEQGTGLGLHIVNELVKLNKGQITVAENDEEGTIFRLFLPQKVSAV